MPGTDFRKWPLGGDLDNFTIAQVEASFSTAWHRLYLVALKNIPSNMALQHTLDALFAIKIFVRL